MDAPFPAGMMPDIERFFRDTHPTLTPGRDVYSEVFESEYFFPLQRPKELAEMVRRARTAGPRCPSCGGSAVAIHHRRPRPVIGECSGCNGFGTTGPITVMEIGADKGGGLYHWCQCLPTVRHVIGCEIRGTPYEDEFKNGFPHINFKWVQHDSLLAESVRQVQEFLDTHVMVDDEYDFPKIDVLFIDGDKLGMWKDFQAYLPLMRRPGGIVFMHDVQDDHPARQFFAVQRAGFRTDLIIDKSEGLEMADRVAKGYVPKNNHEQWLGHWAGRSCGVGVIYL